MILQNRFNILLSLLLVGVSAVYAENTPVQAIYGVCSSNSNTIELQLNEDFSFTYIDRSNPNKIIDVKGTYSIKGNKVKLHPEQSDAKFHSTWRLSEDGKSAKSRHLLAFYRLGLL